MKIILLFCLISLPISGYTQFVTRDVESQELSAESKLLIEQAKKNTMSSSKRKSSVQDAEGFNLAITSSFTGGFIPIYSSFYDFDIAADFFNATSLEIYLPALEFSPKTRLLLTVRFFTPVLGDGIGNSMFLPRLGYGIGVSKIVSDKRNKNGKGLTTSMNFLFAQDFNFLERETVNPFIEAAYTITRFDMSIRMNYFISRNLAVIFGFDIGSGFALEEFTRGDFVGYDITSISHVGFTVGFMI